MTVSLIINLIINGVICVLGIITSYFSGKTIRNNKKIETNLNAIKKVKNDNHRSQKNNLNKTKSKKNNQDEINVLFKEFENELRKLLAKKRKK